ncbi:MAG: hypothetical protein Q8O67_17130 [Deltaproteobacteria bacterium]|nr:hypothetical protein [Deltaproteobacteria bacterium]
MTTDGTDAICTIVTLAEQSLSPSQLRAFIFHVLLGWTQREIATHYRCAQPSVHQAIFGQRRHSPNHRGGALKRLRSAFKENHMSMLSMPLADDHEFLERLRSLRGLAENEALVTMPTLTNGRPPKNPPSSTLKPPPGLALVELDHEHAETADGVETGLSRFQIAASPWLGDDVYRAFGAEVMGMAVLEAWRFAELLFLNGPLFIAEGTAAQMNCVLARARKWARTRNLPLAIRVVPLHGGGRADT